MKNYFKEKRLTAIRCDDRQRIALRQLLVHHVRIYTMKIQVYGVYITLYNDI